MPPNVAAQQGRGMMGPASAQMNPAEMISGRLQRLAEEFRSLSRAIQLVNEGAMVYVQKVQQDLTLLQSELQPDKASEVRPPTPAAGPDELAPPPSGSAAPSGGEVPGGL